MAIELVVSFAMGVSCLIFSVNLVRKLREEDQPPPYHRLSYGIGGRSGSGSGSGGYSGPAAGVVRNKPERGEAEAEGEEGEEGDTHDEEQHPEDGEDGNQRGRGGGAAAADAAAAVKRRRARRSGPGRLAAAPATTSSAADFTRRRGIGSLLSRNAGSRLGVYYDDSDDDHHLQQTAAVAMMTTATHPGNARGWGRDAGRRLICIRTVHGCASACIFEQPCCR